MNTRHFLRGLNMKVLIVDDSKMSQMVIHKFLKELYPDVEAKFAFSGEEALEQFDSFDPDACTIDIIMSGIDGIETSKRITKKKASVKLIIVTSTDEKLEHFKEIPTIKDVINKPITFEKMKNAFAKV